MQIDIAHVCNYLNELAHRSPALMDAIMATNWTCDSNIHPATEFTTAGDMYITNLLGVFNGALGASGHRISVKKIDNQLVFIAVGVSDVNGYLLMGDINANSNSPQ